jgi:hypothetical protein
MDGVDLHIAEMLDCRRRCGRPAAKRGRTVELLSAKPDSPGLGLGDRNGIHLGNLPGTCGWILYFARDWGRMTSRLPVPVTATTAAPREGTPSLLRIDET